MRELRERGAGTLGCIFGLLLLLVAVIVGLKVVPAKIAVADLEDYCRQQAERGSLENDERMHEHILDKATSLNLPVRAEDIKITRAHGQIEVQVVYDMHLKFPLYTYDWHVVTDVERPLF
jgi:hypothetical protein